MENNTQAAAVAEEYPIEVSVPMSARHYGFWDMVATWIGANANTSSWYTGGCIAAVGVMGGLAVIFIANPIAYAIMAMVGYMGYKVGTTSMGLTRASFGIRGSALPSVLNTIQFIGWCAMNTYIAAISLSYLLNSLFGWPAFGQENSGWVMVVGVVFCSIIQILMTVVQGSRSIKIAERVGVIALIILTIWETWVILDHYPLEQIFAWEPTGDFSIRFGEAMDIMVAFSFGWIPAIAEFTRYTKNKRSAVVAPMIGANVALFWFAIVGMFGAIANSIQTGVFDPNTSDPSSIVANLGLGWVAFGVLILATCTTNCVNIYSAGMSVANILPKVGEKKCLYGTAVLTLLISLIPILVGSFYDTFTVFLSYVGFIFAPLLAIMIIDFFVVHKRNYDWSQSATVGGKYWYTNGINWIAVCTWLIGVAVYFLCLRLDFVMNTMGAIYATVLVTAVVYWVANLIFNKNYQKKAA